MNKFPLTFAIIKPHVVSNPIAFQNVRDIIIENQFEIIRSKRLRLSETILEEFYEEHKQKFFYNRLISFMTSGTIEALILYKSDAITSWRNLMGPTKVYKTLYTHPQSIRGQFGLSDTRNCCHGSDSINSVEKEVRIFFPDFNIRDWRVSGS